jgi:hypothetical protein
MNPLPNQSSTDPFEVKRVLATGLTFAEDEDEERAFWLAKTPVERLTALEMLRQLNYGYDPTTARLPRSFEILQR